MYILLIICILGIAVGILAAKFNKARDPFMVRNETHDHKHNWVSLDEVVDPQMLIAMRYFYEAGRGRNITNCEEPIDYLMSQNRFCIECGAVPGCNYALKPESIIQMTTSSEELKKLTKNLKEI